MSGFMGDKFVGDSGFSVYLHEEYIKNQGFGKFASLKSNGRVWIWSPKQTRTSTTFM